MMDWLIARYLYAPSGALMAYTGERVHLGTEAENQSERDLAAQAIMSARVNYPAVFHALRYANPANNTTTYLLPEYTQIASNGTASKKTQSSPSATETVSKGLLLGGNASTLGVERSISRASSGIDTGYRSGVPMRKIKRLESEPSSQKTHTYNIEEIEDNASWNPTVFDSDQKLDAYNIHDNIKLDTKIFRNGVRFDVPRDSLDADINYQSMNELGVDASPYKTSFYLDYHKTVITSPLYRDIATAWESVDPVAMEGALWDIRATYNDLDDAACGIYAIQSRSGLVIMSAYEVGKTIDDQASGLSYHQVISVTNATRVFSPWRDCAGNKLVFPHSSLVSEGVSSGARSSAFDATWENERLRFGIWNAAFTQNVPFSEYINTSPLSFLQTPNSEKLLPLYTGLYPSDFYIMTIKGTSRPYTINTKVYYRITGELRSESDELLNSGYDVAFLDSGLDNILGSTHISPYIYDQEPPRVPYAATPPAFPVVPDGGGGSVNGESGCVLGGILFEEPTNSVHPFPDPPYDDPIYPPTGGANPSEASYINWGLYLLTSEESLGRGLFLPQNERNKLRGYPLPVNATEVSIEQCRGAAYSPQNPQIGKCRPCGNTMSMVFPLSWSGVILPPFGDYISAEVITSKTSNGPIVSVLSNGSLSFSFGSNAEYVVDVLVVNDGSVTRRYPIYRQPSTMLQSPSLKMDEAAIFERHTSAVRTVTPSVTNRVVSAALEQPKKIFVSRVSFKQEISPYDYFVKLDGNGVAYWPHLGGAYSRTITTALVPPFSEEIPDGVIPDRYTGTVYVQVVDTYYCEMQEIAVSL